MRRRSSAGGEVPRMDHVQRPDFDTMLRFWMELLAARGLPQSVRWVFHEDFVRLPHSFAFWLRPASEADRIARFAYHVLDPKNSLVDPRYPLAIAAYALSGDAVITGFQRDVFIADEDVFREDWYMYFDAKDHIFKNSRIITDDKTIRSDRYGIDETPSNKRGK